MMRVATRECKENEMQWEQGQKMQLNENSDKKKATRKITMMNNLMEEKNYKKTKNNNEKNNEKVVFFSYKNSKKMKHHGCEASAPKFHKGQDSMNTCDTYRSQHLYTEQ